MSVVRVFHEKYRVVNHPGPLRSEVGDRFRYKIDHDQRVIWVDPDVPLMDRPMLYARAVAQAWVERRRVMNELV